MLYAVLSFFFFPRSLSSHPLVFTKNNVATHFAYKLTATVAGASTMAMFRFFEALHSEEGNVREVERKVR